MYMIKALAFGAVVCVMSGVGHLRRARITPPPKTYEFNGEHNVGIIPIALAENIQQKTPGSVAQKNHLIENPDDGPETLETFVFPLDALKEEAVFIPGRRFRSCSDVEALALKDFNVKYLVVNSEAAVVGYFEPAIADAAD